MNGGKTRDELRRAITRPLVGSFGSGTSIGFGSRNGVEHEVG
jgi:hypothetical protein